MLQSIRGNDMKACIKFYAVLGAVCLLCACAAQTAQSVPLAVQQQVVTAWAQALTLGQRNAADLRQKAAQEKEKEILRSAVQQGKSYGTVWIENTEVNCAVYWGDTQDILELGAGTHIEGGKLPGQSGTVLIGGHTGACFYGLRTVQLGSRIHIDTPWGKYVYEVTEMCRVQETDWQASRLDSPTELCVLYTCYPFGQLTPTEYRWMIYAVPVQA